MPECLLSASAFYIIKISVTLWQEPPSLPIGWWTTFDNLIHSITFQVLAWFHLSREQGASCLLLYPVWLLRYTWVPSEWNGMECFFPLTFHWLMTQDFSACSEKVWDTEILELLRKHVSRKRTETNTWVRQYNLIGYHHIQKLKWPHVSYLLQRDTVTKFTQWRFHKLLFKD